MKLVINDINCALLSEVTCGKFYGVESIKDPNDKLFLTRRGEAFVFRKAEGITTGEGWYNLFDSVTAAIRCAQEGGYNAYEFDTPKSLFNWLIS